MSKEITERLKSVLNNLEPTQEKRQTLSPDEVRFRSLLIVMENQTMSYREAVKIVGGQVRLQRLMENDKIRYYKPEGSSNTKWRINAADCYRNVRPRLKRLNNLNVM